MIDELTPIERTRLIDRVRFGERYLTDCVDKIIGREVRPIKRQGKNHKNANKPQTEDIHSPYNLSAPKDKPHDFDKNI